MNPAIHVPFCGLPPIPADLWQRWTLQPLLLGALVLVIALSWPGLRRNGTRAQRTAFIAGWTVLGLALVSPLCALSVALFAARASQHMLLLVVAAPLLALGLPAALGPRLTWRLAHWSRTPWRRMVPASLFAALLWAWHLPVLYDATFRSDLAYWSMHLSLLAAALPLWLHLLQPGRDGLLERLLQGFATFMQMGLLGALLTLSPALLYDAHVTTTLAWGLAPLADQQLGGLIMWIPGCASLLLAMLYAIHRALRDAAGPADRVAAES